MKKSDLPIGIFDSGVGGLTVAKEIVRVLPNESFIYLGDTARVPYGTRSKETIKKFALELAKYLLKRKVKCLVVACNTISANALDEVRKISPVGVFDIISPVLKDITPKTGVIATRATIRSGVYPCPGVAAPLFVPLVEEGFANTDASLLVARKYLSGLDGIDSLILGCTHFPMMRETIRKVIKAEIIDPAQALAKHLEEKIVKSTIPAKLEFLVTDDLSRAREVASNFWPESLKYKWGRIKL